MTRDNHQPTAAELAYKTLIDAVPEENRISTIADILINLIKDGITEERKQAIADLFNAVDNQTLALEITKKTLEKGKEGFYEHQKLSNTRAADFLNAIPMDAIDVVSRSLLFYQVQNEKPPERVASGNLAFQAIGPKTAQI